MGDLDCEVFKSMLFGEFKDYFVLCGGVVMLIKNFVDLGKGVKVGVRVVVIVVGEGIEVVFRVIGIGVNVVWIGLFVVSVIFVFLDIYILVDFFI